MSNTEAKSFSSDRSASSEAATGVLDPALTLAALIELSSRTAFKAGRHHGKTGEHSPELQAKMRAIDDAIRARIVTETMCPACKGSGEGPTVNHGDGDMPTPCKTCGGDGALVGDAALQDAYAEGRKDENADCIPLIAWAYGKLHHFNFTKQDDALMLDRIKLLLEHGVHA